MGGMREAIRRNGYVCEVASMSVCYRCKSATLITTVRAYVTSR